MLKLYILSQKELVMPKIEVIGHNYSHNLKICLRGKEEEKTVFYKIEEESFYKRISEEEKMLP